MEIAFLIFLLILGILLIPLQIQAEYPIPQIHIQWFGIGVQIFPSKEETQIYFTCFRFSLLLKKKPRKKEKPKVKKTKLKKKLDWKTLLLDPLLPALFMKLPLLLKDYLGAFHVFKFHCNIGLSDYFYQGVFAGLLSAIPSNKSFQIRGNFLEQNEFNLLIRGSLLHLLIATIWAFFRFPWIKTFKLVKKLI